MTKFYSNGKLLITGEYVVLDGALALAVPTKYGQSLTIEEIESPKILWTSINEKDEIWFEADFQINSISNSQNSSNNITERLIQILNASKKLNPNFLNSKNGFKITTNLDFPNNWGLGTSSTLINNIAHWAQIDPYKLLKSTFDGSGYDIACAQHNTPITYQIKNHIPIVKEIDFNPSFKNQLYLVHINKKQNSREGIAHYKANKENSESAINEINAITNKIVSCTQLESFENLINNHETIISKITKQTPLKQLLFDDFKGSIKSLGAWGGDFILATSQTNPTQYFKEKGFHTIIGWNDMIKKNY